MPERGESARRLMISRHEQRARQSWGPLTEKERKINAESACGADQSETRLTSSPVLSNVKRPGPRYSSLKIRVERAEARSYKRGYVKNLLSPRRDGAENRLVTGTLRRQRAFLLVSLFLPYYSIYLKGYLIT